MLAFAAASVASLALTSPAHANLAITGLMNPQTGFPAWYEDANGTRLQLCIADPGCPISPPVLEPVAPNDEAFYSLVSGTATGPAGQSATMDYAVEAAFLDTPVTFGRVQVTMTGMQPNSDYTFTYPYGTAVWTTDANGNMLSGFRAAARHEVGCFIGFATPCDTTLGTEIGPYLTWDPAESAPPPGYIGDGVTAHTVVGAVNNFIRVTGPGLPVGGISTDRFTVEGKLAVAPFPIFSSAPASGDFGTQRVGTTVKRTITVKNTGLAPTQPLTTTALSGPDAANFAIGADTCAGATLASGATCSIDVALTPGRTGALTASLDLTDAGGTHPVALSGTGGESAISVSPAILDFHNQNVTTTSPAELLTLKNTGPVSLNVSNAAISGPNAAEFAITKNGCSEAVGPGGTCTIGLKFFPGAGGARNASLDLTSDAAPTTHAVPLTGTGTALPSTRPAPRLTLTSLSIKHRLSRRAVKRSGLRLSLGIPKGTSTVNIRVFRVVGKQRRRVATIARVMERPGLRRLTLNSAALQRGLVVGRYVVEVTPSAGAGLAGTTSSTAFRVIR